MESAPVIGLGVIGLGYWGPNLLRNAWELSGTRVVGVCDRNDAALAPVRRRYPDVRLMTTVGEMLGDDEVDAVLIATPVGTHYALTHEALSAGKHVFVEKPMAETSAECRTLMRLADERGLILMPGHTFLYSPPALKVKSILDSGELGELFFATFSRVNLGIHQSDASVVRDLGPHDFSMLLDWLGEPTFVRAIGRDAVGSGQLDVAFVDMGMPNGTLVHMEFSWLAPTKLRRTVLVGRDRMVVYEDTSGEQVRVYDRGVDVIEPQSFGEHQLAYRSGDVLTPFIGAEEPLALELADFLASIRSGSEPRSSARLGLNVVRIIEAAEHSLAHNASPVMFGVLDDPSRGGGDRRRSHGGMPTVPRAGPPQG